MSMATIEKYIQELEAIKNYDKVVKARDELSRKAATLEASLKSTSEELARYKESKVRLVDGGEISLEEARRDFLGTMDSEIEKRAADRFEKLKADYESKMPQLVYQRLHDILKQPWLPEEIAKLIDTEAKKKADAVLHDQNSWPEWFKKLYEEEVKKKVSAELNQEFNARVETAAMARAQQRLNELINAEWPAWYQATVDPKIVELESRINADALQLLKGPWLFTCNQCGTRDEDELTAGEIEQLLRTGQIKVACANPECEDHSLFSTRRHTFQVSLYNLIEVRITG